MSREALVEVALRRSFADVVVLNGRLVNVASGEIYPAGVAIKGDRIAAVGAVEDTVGPDTEIVDADGRFICPGLVEAHLHSYHSYLGIREFSEALLRHGVTTYTDAFYGQGTVGGVEAVRFWKDAFDSMPVRLQFLIPTHAYLQNRDNGLTPAPGITEEEMFAMLDWDGCLGVEEPAPIPVIDRWPAIARLCDEVLRRRMVVTGHAAGLNQYELDAYTAMGVTTDHEAVSALEARDRLRAGYSVFMRMSSASFDQHELVKATTEMGLDPNRLGFCADEASPTKLVGIGTTAHNLRSAVARGVDPITAVQMGTINNASAFFTQHDVGIVAPGRYADLLLVDDLVEFSIARVIVGGTTWVEAGELVRPLPAVEYPSSMRNTVRYPREVAPSDLRVPAPVDANEVVARVIAVEDGSFVTEERQFTLSVADGYVEPDVSQDVLPLVMIDRFEKGTGIGAGFAHGFGLRSGAIGSTVNAVCQNIVVVGASYDDMAVAANVLREKGGGFVIVDDGEVRAFVDLPLLGLMNDEPLDVVMPKFEHAYAVIRELGCDLSSPFVSLEFSFVCPGVPDIKLSDEGLIRVGSGERLDVVVEAR